jgi:hypothetical protein
MKKIIILALITIVTATSCQNKDNVNGVNPLPDVINLDVIAVDDNSAETVTQGPAVIVKVQP